MSIRKVYTTLNVRKAESQTTIEGLHVGDVGSTQLVISLTDGTRAIDLTKFGTVTAIIHGKKPDGYEIHNACTVEGGKIYYTLTAQDTAVSGTVYYQLDVQIDDGSGEERCFSPCFRAQVSERVYEPVFRLLDSEPEDWAQNYANYYKKEDDLYVKNDDPTYAANTFYELVDPPIESASEFQAFWSAYHKTLGVFSEVVEARREFRSLSERLEHTAAPTDEQVDEAVGDYLDENESVIVDKAIIENTEMLSPDVTFNIENDDVADYLSEDDYTFANDNAYSSGDYASTNIEDTIDSAVNERPNGGDITIPAGGVKITLYDTVDKTKWSESITGDTYTVKNLIPNRIYTYTIKNSSGEIIKSGSCKASGQVRFIDAGKATTYPVSDPTQVYQRPLFNIRDLGGWACDGGHIKYGLVYRGCRLNGNYTNDQPERFGISLTPAQIVFFKNFLGIRDEIDFRQLKNDPDTGNTETAGDDAVYETADDIKDTALGIGVDYTIIPLNPYIKGIEIKSSNADMNRRYANVIKRIARDISDNKPCYIHCLEGADRTATVAMLILALCGVSRNNIERDYELTSFSKDYAGNRNRRARNDSAQSYRWMTLIQYLLGSSFNGATFRDKIIDYVLKIGVTIEEINTIRAGLIDGAPEKIKNPNSDVSVTYSLTNINTDNPISSIAMYQPFEATLTALNMKKIQSVVITMGGTDITSTAYNQEKISIGRVTGDVSITAAASDVDISGKADKATTLSGYGITDGQTKIDSSHKLSSDLVDDTDQTNKFVTDTDKTNWNNKLSSTNGAVKSSNIDNGAVTTEKLGSGAVTAAKLGSDVNAILDGKVSKPSTSPNGTNGQLLRTKGDGTTEWVDVGLPTDAQTAEAVSDWLDDHPEATTTVEDGSITTAKLHRGVIDSTLSAQGAAAEAKTTGDYINVLTDRETALDGIVSQEWEIGMRSLVNGVEKWSGTTTSRMSTKPGTYIRFNKDDLIVMKKTMDYQFLVVYSTDNGSTWTSTLNRAIPYSILEDSIGWICIKKTSGTFTEEEMQSVVNNYFFILRKGTGEIKKNALLSEALSIASGSFDRSEIIDSKYGFTYQYAKTTDTVVLSYDLLLPEFEASKGDIFAIKVSILIDYPDMYSNIGVRIYERYNGNTVKTTDITDISDTIIYTVSNSYADAIHIRGLLLADEGDITTQYYEIFDYKISVVKKLPGEIEELLTEAGDIWEV